MSKWDPYLKMYFFFSQLSESKFILAFAHHFFSLSVKKFNSFLLEPLKEHCAPLAQTSKQVPQSLEDYQLLRKQTFDCEPVDMLSRMHKIR